MCEDSACDVGNMVTVFALSDAALELSLHRPPDIVNEIVATLEYCPRLIFE